MSVYRRVAMNTCLKDARIFDEELWEENFKCSIKTEIKTEPLDESDYIKYDNTLVDNSKQNIKNQVQSSPSLNEDNSKDEQIINELEIKREIIRFNIDEEAEDLDDRSTPSPPCISNNSIKKSGHKRGAPYDKMEASTSSKSSDSSSPHRKQRRREMETDQEVLSRRQKQIDYGKNTIGYDNYMKLIPRNKRSNNDPLTPNKHIKYSRRAWDGLIKQWRLRLHKYDPK